MNQPSLSESAEEILAQLWVLAESCALGAGFVNPANAGFTPALSGVEGKPAPNDIAQLIESGLLQQRGGEVTLTDSGKAEAASIIRRERLAERLLTDVIELGEEEATEAACKFEHLLRRGIDDQICTLLGHPRFCPHGSPIPPGDCCRTRSRAAETVISSLADMTPGQSGVVAYIHGRRRELMQRLLAMGVIPGAPVTLVQTVPSYVFQLGQAQLAVDRETAQDIHVRITGRRPSQPATKRRFLPGRLRLRRGRGGR